MDVLLLSESEVQRLLDPDALLEALSTEFVALTRGETSAPPRNEIQVPDAGFLLGMPAWRPGQPIAVKLVSVFHGNQQVGLPDGRGAAIAVQLLARRNSRRVALPRRRRAPGSA